MQPSLSNDPVLAQILAMPDSPNTLLLHGDQAEASGKGKGGRFLAKMVRDHETAPALSAVEYLRSKLGADLEGRSRISVVAAKRVIEDRLSAGTMDLHFSDVDSETGPEFGSEHHSSAPYETAVKSDEGSGDTGSDIATDMDTDAGTGALQRSPKSSFDLVPDVDSEDDKAYLDPEDFHSILPIYDEHQEVPWPTRSALKQQVGEATAKKKNQSVSFSGELKMKEIEVERASDARFSELIDKCLQSKDLAGEIEEAFIAMHGREQCQFLSFVQAHGHERSDEVLSTGLMDWAVDHTCFQSLLDKTLAMQVPMAEQKFKEVSKTKKAAMDFIKADPGLKILCGEDEEHGISLQQRAAEELDGFDDYYKQYNDSLYRHLNSVLMYQIFRRLKPEAMDLEERRVEVRAKAAVLLQDREVQGKLLKKAGQSDRFNNRGYALLELLIEKTRDEMLKNVQDYGSGSDT